MQRHLLAFFAFTSVACGSVQDGSVLLVQASHDVLPASVGSYRVRLTRTSGVTSCGAALTVLDACQTDPETLVVANLCSGTWAIDAAASRVYASTDCSGSPLAAVATMTPSSMTFAYGGSTAMTVHFQATSTINGDALFSSGAIAPAGANSIRFRAQRSFHPDVASCNGSVTTIADQCFAVAPGVDLPPSMLSSSACSGSWILCAVAYPTADCSGAPVEQGISALASVPFGASTTIAANVQPLGSGCSF